MLHNRWFIHGCVGISWLVTSGRIHASVQSSHYNPVATWEHPSEFWEQSHFPEMVNFLMYWLNCFHTSAILQKGISQFIAVCNAQWNKMQVFKCWWVDSCWGDKTQSSFMRNWSSGSCQFCPAFDLKGYRFIHQSFYSTRGCGTKAECFSLHAEVKLWFC